MTQIQKKPVHSPISDTWKHSKIVTKWLPAFSEEVIYHLIAKQVAEDSFISIVWVVVPGYFLLDSFPLLAREMSTSKTDFLMVVSIGVTVTNGSVTKKLPSIILVNGDKGRT